jgi:hypothetical protein
LSQPEQPAIHTIKVHHGVTETQRNPRSSDDPATRRAFYKFIRFPPW